jgi:hypothetical protein
MTNSELTELKEKYRAADPASIRLMQLVGQLKQIYKDDTDLFATQGVTSEAKRAEGDRVFSDLIEEHLGEILQLSETEPIFTPFLSNSIASCQIQFRHTSVKIYIVMASGTQEGALVWFFSVEPLPALKNDFDSWSKYLTYEQSEKVKKTTLNREHLHKEMLQGRIALLDIMIYIDKAHKNAVSNFDAAKKQALEQEAVVEELWERIQKRNSRLTQLIESSEKKIERLVAEAQKNAWTWPKNKKLQLCEIKWQTGSHLESNQPHFDYNSGWAISDKADKDGYYSLLPEVDNIFEDKDSDRPVVSFHKKARKVKPPAAPLITKTEIADMDDLPFRLVVTDYLSLESTFQYMLECSSSGKIYCKDERLTILKSEGSLDRLEDFPEFQGRNYWRHISIGSIPIEEIRLALTA